jgi:DNA-binding transcriptional ArsR family regulator
MPYPPNVKDPNELLVSCNGNAADVFHRMLAEAEPRPSTRSGVAPSAPQAVALQALAPSVTAAVSTLAPTPTPTLAPTPKPAAPIAEGPSFPLTEKPVEVSASREGGHNARDEPSPTDGSLTLRRDGITYKGRVSSLALGRLRVTVKAERGSAFHVDTLDLYASRSRAEFAKRAGKALGSDADTIEQHLLAVLVEAEKMSPDDGAGAATEAEGPPPMTDTERAEALTFLRRPDLLGQVAKDIDALGFVGEDTNKRLLYLVAISRKLLDPLSAIVLSQSGAGKSGLTEVIERLCPPEDVVLLTRLTPQSLYYVEPGFLDKKLVIVEERYGSMEADYSIRVLQSRKKLIAAAPIKDPQTGNMKTRIFTVEARAAFIEATTASAVNHENATRCFELSMDESAEQTKRIHERQRLMRTEHGLVLREQAEVITRRHWNAQRLLEPLPVVIPYADRLTFPDAWMRTRRDHARFLNLIEVSAFLHQHQRERSRAGAIVASVADYAVAYALAAEVLAETLSDLRKPLREVLESIRALSLKGETGTDETAAPSSRSGGSGAVTRRDLREALALPDSTVRRWLAELVELEYLRVAEEGRQGAGKMTRYRIVERGPRAEVVLGLQTPEELRAAIG